MRRKARDLRLERTLKQTMTKQSETEATQQQLQSSGEEERHSSAFQLTNLQLQWDGKVMFQQLGACGNFDT